MERIAASKDFVRGFFPPYNLKEEEAEKLIERLRAGSDIDEQWREDAIHCIENVNFDIVVALALQLGVVEKCTDFKVWRALEETIMKDLH